MAPKPGQAVKVADPRGRPLGTAHYSSSSQISLRMLSRQVEEIGRDFFLRRLRAAEEHRRTVVRNTDAYRVVHGEADLLPALVVDRYGDYLVVQTLDQGMDAAKSVIASCLEEIFHPKGIVARNDVAVRAKEELPLETTMLAGEVPESVTVQDERAHPAGRSHARARRPAFFWISATTTAPPPGTPAAARRSIASPPPAASPCTWPASARAWKPPTVRVRRWSRRAPTPRPTASPISISRKPTSSSC